MIILSLIGLKQWNTSLKTESNTPLDNKEVIYPTTKEVIITEADLNTKLVENLPKEIRNPKVEINAEAIIFRGEYQKGVPLKAEIIGSPQVVENKLSFKIQSAKIAGISVPKAKISELNQEIDKNLNNYLNNVEITNVSLETGKIIIKTKE